ncbi:MAG TPA: HNH endonuclease signature motif containing protein [Candidatus Saccharimonadales bacterium]|jgi:hypothetical protein
MSGKRKPITDFYVVDVVTGCWRWIGTKRGGYGMICNYNYSRKIKSPQEPKMIQASRYIYELHKGQIPAGKFLDHVKEICSYRDCVNPDHLEPVTNKENIRRGRVPVITLAIANEIRNEYNKGQLQCDLAISYGISQATVSQIIRQVTWK